MSQCTNGHLHLSARTSPSPLLWYLLFLHYTGRNLQWQILCRSFSEPTSADKDRGREDLLGATNEFAVTAKRWSTLRLMERLYIKGTVSNRANMSQNGCLKSTLPQGYFLPFKLKLWVHTLLFCFLRFQTDCTSVCLSPVKLHSLICSTPF
jgi:hypothetical protein